MLLYLLLLLVKHHYLHFILHLWVILLIDVYVLRYDILCTIA